MISVASMVTRYRNSAKLACVSAFIFLALAWNFFHRSNEPQSPNEDPKSETTSPSREPKRLVVASLKEEDATWLAKRLPDWPVSRYVVDDPTANLTVPIKKGREAMVYLTYLIDNYDMLPEIRVFIHSLQYQWHNDDPNKDGATVISRLQLPYVESQGYVNMRCAWLLGCPEEIQVDSPQQDRETSIAYREAFLQLFPDKVASGNIPNVVGASCCSQFALTAWKVREKPRSEYERLRNWLIATPLDDAVSGRVLEYSWHMFFGKPDVHCPHAKSCYCDVFGLCNLRECDVGGCKGQYELPPYSTVPKDWKPLPEFGQD